MDLLHNQDRVYVYNGQTHTRQELRDETRTRLIADGKNSFDVDTALVDTPELLARAWWGGEELGFVGETHPLAVPVMVVNLPRGMTRRDWTPMPEVKPGNGRWREI